MAVLSSDIFVVDLLDLLDAGLLRLLVLLKESVEQSVEDGHGEKPGRFELVNQENPGCE